VRSGGDGRVGARRARWVPGAAERTRHPAPGEGVALAVVRSCEATVVEASRNGFVLHDEDGVSVVCGPNPFEFAPIVGRLLAG
jgi:hypothetical protein